MVEDGRNRLQTQSFSDLQDAPTMGGNRIDRNFRAPGCDACITGTIRQNRRGMKADMRRAQGDICALPA